MYVCRSRLGMLILRTLRPRNSDMYTHGNFNLTFHMVGSMFNMNDSGSERDTEGEDRGGGGGD